MAKVVSALLAALLAASEPPSDTYFYDLQPACVCSDCKDGPIIKDSKSALIVGEAFARIRFGDNVLARYKPLMASRHDRSRSGAIWIVLGQNLRRPDRFDAIEILIDEETGCLLKATYSE